MTSKTPWGNPPEPAFTPPEQQGPENPFANSSMTPEKWAHFEKVIDPIGKKYKNQVHDAIKGFMNDCAESDLADKANDAPAAMIMFALNVIKLASSIGGASAANHGPEVIDMFIDEVRTGFEEGRGEFIAYRDDRSKPLTDLLKDLEAEVAKRKAADDRNNPHP